jgi:uncharacterized DUF497 family protein
MVKVCNEISFSPILFHNSVHGVSELEAEQVFFNILLLFSAARNSTEERLSVHGKTDLGRELFVVFTIRTDLIRVISARPMHEIERKQYHAEAN